VPARFSATVSPTMSTTGSFDLISATMPDDVVMRRTSRAAQPERTPPRVSRGLSSARNVF
jgi:hypothetical protein